MQEIICSLLRQNGPRLYAPDVHPGARPVLGQPARQRTEVEVHVVGVPRGDGGGEVDPRLGRQLHVSLGVFQPQEVPGLRLLGVQRVARRARSRSPSRSPASAASPLPCTRSAPAECWCPLWYSFKRKADYASASLGGSFRAEQVFTTSGDPGVAERVAPLLAAESRVDADHDEGILGRLGSEGRLDPSSEK
jgi:hypothetical protein